MPSAVPSRLLVLALCLALLAAILAVAFFRSAAKPPAPIAATRPAAATASAPAPAAPLSYVELVRRSYPVLAATQPLAVPLDLREAAHLVLPHPVYLDATGRLWITHPAAPALEQVFDELSDQDVVLTRERVLFVHWGEDRYGRSKPWLVCLDAPSGQCQLVDSTRRRPLGAVASYRWGDAFSWEGRIVVPTDMGVSVFTVGDKVDEIPSPALAGALSPHTPVQVLVDWHGLLAWSSAEGTTGRSLSTQPTVARFVEGKWTSPGPADQWPAALLHLVPMGDGTVLQVRITGKEQVALRYVALPDAQVEPKELDQLNAHPAIGSMTLLGDRLGIVGRLADRGVVFYAPKGVAVRQPNQEDPDYTVPAFIVLRPGRAAALLQVRLARLLEGQPMQLNGWEGEWLVLDDAHGARYFDGVRLAPFLRRKEHAFTQLVGIDRRGRWLLRAPGAPADAPCLLIDPTLPDPAPRLAVWQVTVPGQGLVGWDQHNWPVMKSGSAWALEKEGWQAIDERKRPFYSLAGQIPPATRPATLPSTATTQPALLVAADGTTYYDGTESLRIVYPTSRPGPRELDWPLPGLAVGEGPATLLQTPDGMLYLFNLPGRVVRLRPTPAGPEPFVHDATFTRKIPNIPHPTRIWLDPAGRIIIAYESSKLAILFPGGHIPPAIRELMPPEEEDTAEAD